MPINLPVSAEVHPNHLLYGGVFEPNAIRTYSYVPNSWPAIAQPSKLMDKLGKNPSTESPFGPPSTEANKLFRQKRTQLELGRLANGETWYSFVLGELPIARAKGLDPAALERLRELGGQYPDRFQVNVLPNNPPTYASMEGGFVIMEFGDGSEISASSNAETIHVHHQPGMLAKLHNRWSELSELSLPLEVYLSSIGHQALK